MLQLKIGQKQIVDERFLIKGLKNFLEVRFYLGDVHYLQANFVVSKSYTSQKVY